MTRVESVSGSVSESVSKRDGWPSDMSNWMSTVLPSQYVGWAFRLRERLVEAIPTPTATLY